MTMTWSRLMSAATATYGVYALTEPRHLGRALTDNRRRQGDYDLLAQMAGARDVAIGAVGVFGTQRAVSAAMVIRVLCDIADGLLVSARVDDDETRAKVFVVTFGWATLNLVALARDRRVSRRSRAGLG